MFLNIVEEFAFFRRDLSSLWFSNIHYYLYLINDNLAGFFTKKRSILITSQFAKIFRTLHVRMARLQRHGSGDKNFDQIGHDLLIAKIRFRLEDSVRAHRD